MATVSGTRQAVTKQSEARSRVLDLIEQLHVGDAIPSERQLTREKLRKGERRTPVARDW